jgi:hypothetical protein
MLFYRAVDIVSALLFSIRADAGVMSKIEQRFRLVGCISVVNQRQT